MIFVTFCQAWRDLAEIANISPSLRGSCHDVRGFLKSRRDFVHPAEIAKISPRLPRSHHVVRNSVNLGKTSPRSCRDFERPKHLTEISKISPRSRRDLERTRVSPRPHQNCQHFAESGEIVENIYSPRSFPKGMSNFLL